VAGVGRSELGVREDKNPRTPWKTILATLILVILMASAADAYTGRRQVLYTEASVMLAVNEPYRWGSTDCSGMMWRLLRKTFPELGIQRWFKRTTAEVMAGWPWKPVMKRSHSVFGDLLFCGSPRIDHVMMSWTKAPQDAIHAARSKGFSRTLIDPYWTNKISVIVRPPF
jgi:hypothetical protein